MSKMYGEQNYYNISDLLDTNCMDYARYVLTSRAIPDLRDGCKPIHRRIVWAFYKDKITYDKPRSKSVNACGRVLAYSPHGDASVYDACVRLANDSVLINLIDGKGSFSSVTSRDIQAGASRYTEVRLSEFTTVMLQNIEKNVVNMKLNYDESKYEPEVLPVALPLILCNPNQGIGVGLSSTICSFNLKEVVDYTINQINGKQTNYLYPDFPTGGEYITNDTQIKNIDKNGKGFLKIRAKYHIENNSIIITEIPYTTTREVICEKIISLVKEGKIKEVVDINDYTGIDGLNITIDVKKNTDIENLMKKLFKMTTLEDTFSCNFTVLHNGKPQVLGVKSIIIEWIKFRQSCITRELQYDITQNQEELNKLKGLEIIMSSLDKAISIIRNSKTEKDALLSLIKEFSLNKEQVSYIITIKLVNMNKDWLHKKTQRIKEIEKTIKSLEKTLKSDTLINEIIISQLEEIKKKYGQPRRTQIIEEKEIEIITQEDMIENYNCNLVLSKEGYIKKTLRQSDTQKFKDGDELLQQMSSTNKSKILLFTDKQNVYFLNSYELDTTQPSSIGDYVYTKIKSDGNEKVIYMVSTEDYKGDMIFAFENGKIARVDLQAYETKTNRSKMINAYDNKSQLIFISHIAEDKDIICISSIDKCVLCNTSLISGKLSKTSQGNQVLKQKNDSIMNKCFFINIDTENNINTELEYYRVAPNSVGKFIRKEDIDVLK